MAKKSMGNMENGTGSKMSKTSEEIGSKYGAYLFIAGIVLALVLGAFSSMVPANFLPIGVALLAVLGFAVGLFNISESEMDSFLIAAAALLVASQGFVGSLVGLSAQVAGVPLVVDIFNIVIGLVRELPFFVAPAAGLVAVKSVWKLAKDR